MVTLVTESPAMRSDIQIAFNNGQAFYATIINTITVQTGMGWVTYWVI
ncbi:MAG: hypothetical protein LRY41_03235 [Candidatus Pacebacteria bacterium]|nr:hypothetical protein [Candidatus Paceibacterota bacterium]MCD8528308.1 hypothetical protein [Candidatus Paceibacterota bacterium]